MEESMNGWVSFPTTMNMNMNEAIRRFCPARLEQQGRDDDDAWEFEEDEALSLTLHEINELWCPLGAVNPSSDEDHFVNSFFNMDSYAQESPNQNHHHHHHHPPCDLFWQGVHVVDLDSFPMMATNDDVYQEDIPMMIEGGDIEMSSSWCEEEARYFVPTYDSTTSIQEEVSHGVDQGLHLVHLLLACAEAVGCRDAQLADSILTQIRSHSNPWGDSMQRVSYCFAMGLKSRLSLLENVHSNGATDVSLITRKEKMEASRLLHQTTPYIGFGFMAFNGLP